MLHIDFIRSGFFCGSSTGKKHFARLKAKKKKILRILPCFVVMITKTLFSIHFCCCKCCFISFECQSLSTWSKPEFKMVLTIQNRSQMKQVTRNVAMILRPYYNRAWKTTFLLPLGCACDNLFYSFFFFHSHLLRYPIPTPVLRRLQWS